MWVGVSDNDVWEGGLGVSGIKVDTIGGLSDNVIGPSGVGSSEYGYRGVRLKRRPEDRAGICPV